MLTEGNVMLSLCAMDFHRPSELNYLFLLDCHSLSRSITLYLVTYFPVLTRYFFTLLVPSVRFLSYLSSSSTFHSRHRNLLLPSIHFWAFPASSPTFLVVTDNFYRT